MGTLTLEAIGSEGERLAMRAGELTEIAVGFDPDLSCATFDSDELTEPELEGIVFDALGNLDPDWRSQLRVAE